MAGRHAVLRTGFLWQAGLARPLQIVFKEADVPVVHLDWRGLESFTRDQFAELMSLDTTLWHKEFKEHDALFQKLRQRLPRTLEVQRELLELGF